MFHEMIQNYIASSFRKLLIRNGFKLIRKSSTGKTIKQEEANESYENVKTETSRNVEKKDGAVGKDLFTRAKVVLFGANGMTGHMTAFLLKQSPLISDLYLLDKNDTKGHGLDLSHINTKCKIHTASSYLEAPDIVKDADIVVLASGRSFLSSLKVKDLFEVNAGIVESQAMICATACPDAIVAVAAYPVAYNVPLVSEVYKRKGVYNPDKIIGTCTLHVMCANTLVGNEFYLDPQCIHVPLAGGMTAKTMVPLLSKAQPFAEFPQEDAERLTEEIQQCFRKFARTYTRPIKAARAYAINRFVLTLVRGLMNQPDAIMTAFVRSSVLPHCKYCATQLLFGPHGVKLNFGIPKLTPYELDVLSTSIAELTEIIKFVEKFAEDAMDYRRRRSIERCWPQSRKREIVVL